MKKTDKPLPDYILRRLPRHHWKLLRSVPFPWEGVLEMAKRIMEFRDAFIEMLVDSNPATVELQGLSFLRTTRKGRKTVTHIRCKDHAVPGYFAIPILTMLGALVNESSRMNTDDELEDLISDFIHDVHELLKHQPPYNV